MVGEAPVVRGCPVHDGLVRRVGEPGRGEQVVDPPPGVVVEGPPAVAPPRVRPVDARVPFAHHVAPAVFEQLREPLPLVRQETGVAPVPAPVAQVQLGGRDVPVPADDHLPAGGGAPVERGAQVVAERGTERVLGVLFRRARLPLGQVQRGHGEPARQVHLEIAAVEVGRGVGAVARSAGSARETDPYGLRLLTTQHGDAVAPLRRQRGRQPQMPAARVERGQEGGRQLVGQGPDLLQADRPRVGRGQPLQQPLGGGGTDPVDVDRGEGVHAVYCAAPMITLRDGFSTGCPGSRRRSPPGPTGSAR